MIQKRQLQNELKINNPVTSNQIVKIINQLFYYGQLRVKSTQIAKFKILFLLFAITIANAGYAQIDTNNYILFLKAINQYGTPQQTLQYFETIPAAKITPDLLILKSLALFKNGSIKESTNLAVQCYPKHEKALNYHLARCYAALGKPNIAVDYLKKHMIDKNKTPLNKIKSDKSFISIENSPEWIQLWRTKEWYSKYELQLEDALYQLKLGNLDEAFLKLDHLTQIRKSMHVAMYYKARVYQLQNDLTNALIAINLALTKDADNALYYYQKSSIEYDLAKYKKALKSINKAILLDDTQIDFYIQQVQINLKLKRINPAIQDFKIIENTINTSKINFLAAKIYHESGDNIKALQAINQCILTEKYNPEYYLQRAEIYSTTYAYEFAEKDYSMALDFLPKQADIYYNRGIARVNQKNYKGACYDFNKAYQLKHTQAADAINKFCQKQH